MAPDEAHRRGRRRPTGRRRATAGNRPDVGAAISRARSSPQASSAEPMPRPRTIGSTMQIWSNSGCRRSGPTTRPGRSRRSGRRARRSRGRDRDRSWSRCAYWFASVLDRDGLIDAHGAPSGHVGAGHAGVVLRAGEVPEPEARDGRPDGLESRWRSSALPSRTCVHVLADRLADAFHLRRSSARARASTRRSWWRASRSSFRQPSSRSASSVAVGERGRDRAARLAVVLAVAEPAGARRARRCRRTTARARVGVPQRELAHAGRVEDERRRPAAGGAGGGSSCGGRARRPRGSRGRAPDVLAGEHVERASTCRRPTSRRTRRSGRARSGPGPRRRRGRRPR